MQKNLTEREKAVLFLLVEEAVDNIGAVENEENNRTISYQNLHIDDKEVVRTLYDKLNRSIQ
jgi:hypothetical protein